MLFSKAYFLKEWLDILYIQRQSEKDPLLIGSLPEYLQNLGWGHTSVRNYILLFHVGEREGRHTFKPSSIAFQDYEQQIDRGCLESISAMPIWNEEVLSGDLALWVITPISVNSVTSLRQITNLINHESILLSVKWEYHVIK